MQLTDKPERKLAVQIMKERAGDVTTILNAVVTACNALIAGDTTGQFTDEAALDAAVKAQRDAYLGVTIPGLGDVSDFFTFAE